MNDSRPWRRGQDFLAAALSLACSAMVLSGTLALFALQSPLA